MHMSLSSPVVAGAAAVGCAAALTAAPAAPVMELPPLSMPKAVVALAAWDSPLTAVLETGQLALNYLLTPTYSSDPVTNWGTTPGIGLEWNELLPLIHDPVRGFLPHITAVGLIPNFIQVPFPILGQMVENWMGYARLMFQPGGLATIAADLAVKTSAVVTAIGRLVPEITAVMSYQLDVLRFSVTNAFTGVTSALAAGDWEGAWNATVSGFLSPNGVPGTLLNLSIGAGLQTRPDDPETFIPSIRSELQTVGQELSSALAETAPGSAAAASTEAAVKATTRTAAKAKPGRTAPDSISKPAPRHAAATRTAAR